jgi:hypothetical protein
MDKATARMSEETVAIRDPCWKWWQGRQRWRAAAVGNHVAVPQDEVSRFGNSTDIIIWGHGEVRAHDSGHTDPNLVYIC